MNIDHLPFSSFALESFTRPGPAVGGQTLTLQLALAPALPFHDPMEGTAVAGHIESESPLRAAVLPASGQAITITF